MASNTSLSLLFLGPVEALPGKLRRPQPAPRRKTWALLAYLVVTGQAYHRSTLAGLFCQAAADPARALRVLLSRIRQQVGPEVIVTEGDTIRFHRPAAWVDCLEFARVLEGDLARPSLAQLETAANLYRGDFLAGLNLPDSAEFEIWLLGQRARLRHLYERGLAEIVARLIAQTAYDAAIQRTQQLLRSNSLLEEAHAQLIWLYAQIGRHEAALEQFELCRALLWRELAVEPAPEVMALYAAVRAGRPAATFSITPAAPATTALLQSPDFVGREAELAQLQEAWQATLAGRGGVVLVAAEAGGGKSRLAQEFGQQLPAGSFLAGRCYESTTALAYHPWPEILETRLAGLAEAGLQRLAPLTQAHLARLLPGLRPRFPARLPTPGHELEPMFAAVRELLLPLPGRGEAPVPLLVFVDDLQWAGETSLRLFHFLARHAGQSGLLLVGAYRSEEVEDAPTLQTLLNDLQPLSFYRLSLTSLTPMAVNALARQLWPQLPEGYRPHVAARLAQATDGNPLFITELLRELSGSVQVPAELPVPATVRDLIGRRLGHLSHSGRQVIEALAVLPRATTLTDIQEMSARSEDEVALTIDWGLRRGLLQAQPDTRPVRYDFHHDLVREAVARQLSQARRELLHRRAARALEKSGAKAALLAYHWRMAGDTGQEGRYAALAGEQAAAVYAHDEAVSYFERALALLPPNTRRVAVMCSLGDVWLLTGQWPAAETMYRQALAAAQTLAELRLQARCQASLGKLMSRQSRYQEALAWLEQAHALCEAAGDREGVARNVGVMGIVYWQMDEYERSLACYEQALQINRQLGNQTGEAIWVSNIAGIHDQAGAYEQALAGYQQALRIHLALGNKVEAGICLGNLGSVYRKMGAYRPALACYEQALQHRHMVGDEAGVAFVVRNMGTLYAQTGFYAWALACYRQALQIDLKLRQKEGVADAVGQMADLYLAQGEDERALACLDHSIPLLRLVGGKYYLCRQLVAKAMLLFRSGQYAQAQVLGQEGQAMAGGVSQEVHFSARLLSIRLDVALERLDGLAAIQELQLLSPDATNDGQRAAIQYEIWRFDRRREDTRQVAAELYRHLYARTPDVTYRQRYEELTGHHLPDPPPLPELPATVTANPVDLAPLLAQVDQLTITPTNNQ